MEHERLGSETRRLVLMDFLRIVVPEVRPQVINALGDVMQLPDPPLPVIDELLSRMWVDEGQLRARLEWQREEYGDG